MGAIAPLAPRQASFFECVPSPLSTDSMLTSACAGLVVEEAACAAGFSGRPAPSVRPAGGQKAFSAGPRKGKARVALPLGCRGITARYDAGQLPPRQGAASDLQSAAKLRLHSLLHRVQG